jgi:archaeal type IV pilus assembly protein PilA
MCIKKNDEAVSSVVGVILMVAITMILAAIVGAFVFGMVGETKAGHSIAVTTSYSSGDIVMVYNGGDGNNYLTGITVTLNDGTPVEWVPAGVGATKTFAGPYTKPTKALITAHYNDGSEYIVINTNI